MPVATAEQIRNRQILVPIPGTDLQIACKRPDPLDLIARGILPLETFHAVLAKLIEWNQGAAPSIDEVLKSFAEEGKDFVAYLDRWVCAAAVSPAIVLTEEEAAADAASLWIGDVDNTVKFAIVSQTSDRLLAPRVSAAVTEFRRQLAARADAGPDGPAVSHAAVDVVADPAPATGA